MASSRQPNLADHEALSLAAKLGLLKPDTVRIARHGSAGEDGGMLRGLAAAELADRRARNRCNGEAPPRCVIANLLVPPISIGQVERGRCRIVGAGEAQDKLPIPVFREVAAEAGCLTDWAQPLQEAAECGILEVLRVGRQRAVEELVRRRGVGLGKHDLAVSPSPRCHEALVGAPETDGGPGRSREVECQGEAKMGRGTVEAGFHLHACADGLRQSRGVSAVVAGSWRSPDRARRVDFRDPGGLVHLQVAGHVLDLPRGRPRAARAAALRAGAAAGDVGLVQQEVGLLGLVQDPVPMPMLQEVVAKALAGDVQDQRPVDPIGSREALHRHGEVLVGKVLLAPLLHQPRLPKVVDVAVSEILHVRA
mmetsp:Transcript_5501/g.15907  ORF Transcript_5501/g.15907 Transcript_5501/m.15907 type:complete len:366 (+) Transcript_5501:274-1371(+)